MNTFLIVLWLLILLVLVTSIFIFVNEDSYTKYFWIALLVAGSYSMGAIGYAMITFGYYMLKYKENYFEKFTENNPSEESI